MVIVCAATFLTAALLANAAGAGIRAAVLLGGITAGGVLCLYGILAG